MGYFTVQTTNTPSLAEHNLESHSNVLNIPHNIQNELFLTLLCKNSPASLSRGMNCTFNGLASIFFLCGWGDAITFQMLSDKCYIICRLIICNIERWGKSFNKLIFFLSFFKHGLKKYILKM